MLSWRFHLFTKWMYTHLESFDSQRVVYQFSDICWSNFYIKVSHNISFDNNDGHYSCYVDNHTDGGASCDSDNG
jgi:hypothetical protein